MFPLCPSNGFLFAYAFFILKYLRHFGHERILKFTQVIGVGSLNLVVVLISDAVGFMIRFDCRDLGSKYR